MSLMLVAMWCVAVLVCVGAVLWVYMNVRARRIASRLGAFRCWSRPDVQSGWTAGIGVYGVDDLSWYRLVGLSLQRSTRCPVPALRYPLRSPTRRTGRSSRCASHTVSIVTRLPSNA